MARQHYFTHFERNQTSDGVKTGDPQEKTPDHLQAELGLSHIWLELGSNPQRWDDERFRALKISDLNHSAIGGHLFRDLHPGKSQTSMHEQLQALAIVLEFGIKEL